MQYSQIEELLEQKEIQSLKKFNADKNMRDAVKKVLFAIINHNGVVKKGKDYNPAQNIAFSSISVAQQTGRSITDEEIGQDVRALWEGIRIVENAWGEFLKFVDDEEIKEPKNSAR